MANANWGVCGRTFPSSLEEEGGKLETCQSLLDFSGKCSELSLFALQYQAFIHERQKLLLCAFLG